jgi:hypothetical protein
MLARLAAIAFCTASFALAQLPHQGNGVGGAFLSATHARIGSTLELTCGSAVTPNGIAALCLSDGFGPLPGPSGLVCLDYNSAGFFVQPLLLDGQGNATLTVPIANTASLVANPPLFALAITFEPIGWSISKTARIGYELPGAYRVLPALGTARALHTATRLGVGPAANETRVLVTGGGGGTVLQPLATATTELWLPLTRTASPGPTMSVERTLHRAVPLADGRVLIIGGAASNGVVTTSCELFDPTTNTLSPTGSLTSPRVGHAATRLGNGKVLVSGGLTTYVDPVNNFVAITNTAQNTAELYDPTTGQWTAVPGTMAQKRSAHTQTLLDDGRVLIAGGIRGATTSTLFGTPVPIFTGSCTLYDPNTNSLGSTGSLVFERGFHAASVLANGDVLLTGGSQSNTFLGSINATDRCERWNGSTWSTVAALPTPLTNHAQERAANGAALVFGGLTGSFPNLTASATAGRHTGSAWQAGNALGLSAGFPGQPVTPRGALTATALADGSWLLLGGSDGVAALTSALVFVP